ncbi:MAG: hypothetical protein U1E70_13075 [Acetobacteraceae bacterium]
MREAEDGAGARTVFLGVERQFVKAVKVVKTITARAEVTSVREDKPICTSATTVRQCRRRDMSDRTATTYTVPLRR